MLEQQEVALLLEAARTVDLCDELEAALRKGGPLVESPQGQKANPAAVEVRQQRLTLARLLASLRILLDEADRGLRPQGRPTGGVYGLRPGA